MSLKNRVGNFLILFGLIALIIFGATVLAPPEAVDGPAFLAGATLLGVGLKFRLAKSPRGAPSAHTGPPPAAAGGPPPGGSKPRRQGLFATVLKGPAKPKTAPAKAGPPPSAPAKGGKSGKPARGAKGPAKSNTQGGGKGPRRK
jgi:hypothetical protein